MELATLLLIMQYAQYVPLAIQLIKTIRAAERNFPRAGSGAEKSVYVLGAFLPLVAEAGKAGLVNPKAAEQIVKIAPQLIKLIVDLMNAHGGVLVDEQHGGPLQVLAMLGGLAHHKDNKDAKVTDEPLPVEGGH